MIYQYFQPGPGHSRSNAYLLALLSYYIYEDEVPKPPGLAVINPVDRENLFKQRFIATFEALSPPANQFAIAVETAIAEFAVLSAPNLILVGFRGTDEISDWVSAIPGGNFSSQMITTPPNWGSVKVHANYYQTLNLVYGSVRDRVRNHVGQDTRVFLTGHSRGGALATLCAYRLKQIDKIDVAGVYTFGAPRVGNSHFRALYRNAGLWDRTFRWVRRRDMGPRWPDIDPISFDRYFHVGNLYYIAGNGQVTAPDPEFEPARDDIQDATYGGGDHDMFVYCTLMYLRLNNAVRQRASLPASLVKQDVPNGLPHLSPGMIPGL